MWEIDQVGPRETVVYVQLVKAQGDLQTQKPWKDENLRSVATCM
jgi:hypothetical protein